MHHMNKQIALFLLCIAYIAHGMNCLQDTVVQIVATTHQNFTNSEKLPTHKVYVYKTYCNEEDTIRMFGTIVFGNIPGDMYSYLTVAQWEGNQWDYNTC